MLWSYTIVVVGLPRILIWEGKLSISLFRKCAPCLFGEKVKIFSGDVFFYYILNGVTGDFTGEERLDRPVTD